jgi:hypothetical protein
VRYKHGVPKVTGEHTKLDPRVEASIRTQNIQSCLSVVAFAGLVDLGLSKHDQRSTVIVPFQLDFITLEEVLL